MITALLVLAALFVVARLVLVPRLSATSAAAGAVETGGARTLADCPGTPNCVGSESTDPARRVERLRVPGGPGAGANDGAALDAVARWIGSQPDATLVSRDADYLHATFRSRLMGYTDDVEFLAAPGGGLAVRSASRLGRSDLGANRKRVERIRAALAG